MQRLTLTLILLFLLTACSTTSQNTITGNSVADIQRPSEETLASNDCHVVIQVLQQEITALEQEKELKETELGKKIRETRAQNDEQALQQLNTEIDALSQRVKEIRKGLLPTLEAQLAAKQRICA